MGRPKILNWMLLSNSMFNLLRLPLWMQLLFMLSQNTFFCVLFNDAVNCQEYECWWWMNMEQLWNNSDGGKMDLLGITRFAAPFSTTVTPQTCLGSNLGQIFQGFLAKKWNWTIPLIIITIIIMMSCIMVMINWYDITFLCVYLQNKLLQWYHDLLFWNCFPNLLSRIFCIHPKCSLTCDTTAYS